MHSLRQRVPATADVDRQQDDTSKPSPRAIQRAFPCALFRSSHITIYVLLCLTFLLADAYAHGFDSALSIINAGVQSSEDGPIVPPSFRFMPGDDLHGTFQIAGFAIKQSGEQTRSISLKYSATIEDGSGRPYTEPVTGAIETELSNEDKSWTPKRRISFALPSFLASGKAQLRIQVNDAIANTAVTKTVPFTVGGVTVIPADSVSIQHLQFLRGENDREALDLPAYSPGDPVFARFEIVNFRTEAQNAYHVVYDLLVLRPDGKPFIQQPHAAELTGDGFYPAQFLPGTLQLTTSRSSTKGSYLVNLTVHDLIAKTTYGMKSAFTLE